MKHGWVDANILDMRAKPAHDSERVNQALFSEAVQILSEKGGFIRIRQTDNYTGWVDERMVLQLEPNVARQLSGFNCIVVSSQAKVYDRNGKPCPPYLLYYGTRLTKGKQQDKWTTILLPDKSKVFVKTQKIRPIKQETSRLLTGPKLVQEAKTMMGIPYLWGGVSSIGFDCSGFVRTIFRTCGIELARDAKDQIHVGRQVARSEVRTGDLLFFERHVGIAVGTSQLIHASRAAGGVHLESLCSSDPRYRSDLDRGFAQARRVI